MDKLNGSYVDIKISENVTNFNGDSFHREVRRLAKVEGYDDFGIFLSEVYIISIDGTLVGNEYVTNAKFVLEKDLDTILGFSSVSINSFMLITQEERNDILQEHNELHNKVLQKIEEAKYKLAIEKQDVLLLTEEDIVKTNWIDKLPSDLFRIIMAFSVGVLVGAVLL